jgi:hypothetical protein
MDAKPTIDFQENSLDAADFLHELNDPDLLRNGSIPPQVSVHLRKSQVLKLKENIAVLTAKREEFVRKIEEYVQSLKSLISSMERGLQSDMEKLKAAESTSATHATVVRCLACETQRTFKGIQVIFAKESEESFSQPTQVYVLEGASLKKGQFNCRRCGVGSLVIRSC